MKRIITKEQKQNLITDFETGKFSMKDLAIKYGYKSGFGVQQLLTSNGLYESKKQNRSVTSVVSTKASVNKVNGKVKSVKPAQDKELLETMKAKIMEIPTRRSDIEAKSTHQPRTISFPDGFKIQIEKSFVNGLFIHDNGNITILK